MAHLYLYCLYMPWRYLSQLFMYFCICLYTTNQLSRVFISLPWLTAEFKTRTSWSEVGSAYHPAASRPLDNRTQTISRGETYAISNSEKDYRLLQKNSPFKPVCCFYYHFRCLDENKQRWKYLYLQIWWTTVLSSLKTLKHNILITLQEIVHESQQCQYTYASSLPL